MKKIKQVLLGLTALCVTFACACNFTLSWPLGGESSNISATDSVDSSKTESSIEETSSKEESSKNESSSEETSSVDESSSSDTISSDEEGSAEESSSEETSSVDESSSSDAISSEEEGSVEESSSEETSSVDESSSSDTISGEEEEVHTHELLYMGANAGDCQNDGNIAYYTCEGCGKYFADEDGEEELSEEDLYVTGTHLLTFHEGKAPSGKNNGIVDYYDCGVCGKYFSDLTGLNELTEKELVILSVYNIPDFIVEVESGKEPVVLQLSDPQLCNWGNLETYCYQYVREAINETKPDFIIITGDLVYGRFDPKGELLQSLISFLEGFKIPWAPVFGNHDNESLMGVDWQCAQLEAAEYCLFKQGDLTGNGNYSVGIAQNDELLRVFYMMDSNGCSKPMCDSGGNQTAPAPGTNVVKTSAGFGQDQIDWYTKEIKAIHALDADVKISFAYHIQQQIFQKAFEKYDEYDSTAVSSALVNPLNLDTLATADDTDFGYVGRVMKGAWDTNYAIFYGMKALGVDSIFVGHEHCNSSSIVYQGVRFQYSQKSSRYDRYNTVTADGTITGGYDADHPAGAHLLMGGTVIPMSSTDGSIGTGYIYYAGNPFYFEPIIDVDGLKFGTHLTSQVVDTVKGVVLADGTTAYRYMAGDSWNKLYICTSTADCNKDALKGKKSVSFDILFTENTATEAFAVRIKPNPTQEQVPHINQGYLYFDESYTDERKVVTGEWKTVVIDISTFADDCTEFSIYLFAGTTAYVRNIAIHDDVFSGGANENPTPETPDAIPVNGLQLSKDNLKTDKISVQAAAYDTTTNAYKVVSSANSQKVYFDVSLAVKYDIFTFTVLVDKNTSITGSVEFYLRVKPDGTLTEAHGSSDGKYVYYQTTSSNVLRSVTRRGEWKTFTLDISNVDETCTEFSFMFDAGAIVWFKDIAFKNAGEEPFVNGLEIVESMLQENYGMSVEMLAFDDATYAYKVYAEKQGKIFFDTALAAQYNTFTFSVLIPENSAGGGSSGVEFFLRVKPDGTLTDDNTYADSKHVYFQSGISDERRSVVRGEWKTFTVDISNLDSTCTEFSLMLSAGTTMWIKDVSFS